MRKTKQHRAKLAARTHIPRNMIKHLMAVNMVQKLLKAQAPE